MLAVGAAEAGEWPMFKRDAERTAYNPYEEVPETPEVAWVFHADGGLSSPVVSGLDLFVGSEDGNLYAISIHSGREHWQFSVGSEVSAPAVVNGKVYFGSLNGFVYCVDVVSREEIWKYKTEGRIRSAPAVVEGVVYVASTDNRVYALNTENGAKIWVSRNLGAMITSSPTVVERGPHVPEKRIYVTTWNGDICALNENGSVVWVYRPRKIGALENYPIVSTPAYSKGELYVGSNDGNLYAIYNISENGEARWWHGVGSKVSSSPAVDGNRVYFGAGDGRVYAVSTDVKKLEWSYQTGGEIHTSPALGRGTVVVGSADGFLYNLTLEGELLWKLRLGPMIRSSPALAYGKIFVGTEDGKLYCIGSWGEVADTDISKGLIFLGIGLVFLLLLIGYGRLKPPKPKRAEKER
jgi:outer membrane protein assembly factor BamB